jgi:hypothetical protein
MRIAAHYRTLPASFGSPLLRLMTPQARLLSGVENGSTLRAPV